MWVEVFEKLKLKLKVCGNCVAKHCNVQMCHGGPRSSALSLVPLCTDRYKYLCLALYNLSPNETFPKPHLSIFGNGLYNDSPMYVSSMTEGA